MTKSKKNLTNVEIGDELRDKVYELLLSRGKQNVQREYILEGKKADVYFEDELPFYGKLRVAVECKNYSAKLGVGEISKIIYDYDSSKAKCFDRLIILHREGLQANAQLKVREKEWISIKRFDELYFELFNFRDYLTYISTLFEIEGLDHYYISPKDDRAQEIEGLLEAWENDPAVTPPVAILAGYGMGKTSLSYKIAKQHAESILDGNICRIPIYLRLGDFVSETSVESLICTTFGSTYPVDGFNFERFIKLNKLGHFLIIFDGFDEMKHAMPFLVFKKIFKNICDLITDKSKIIVLGRPSAFTTEYEKDQILHGMDSAGGIVLKDPSLADFQEISISNFDVAGSKEFISRYFTYRQSKAHISDYMRSQAFKDQRIQEMSNNLYQELIKRPVHARMLVELSLSHDKPMEAITRYHLYDKFINLFFEREFDKNARKNITIADRREFIELIAYHFWKLDGRRGFHIREIKSIKHNVEDLQIHNTGDDLHRELLIGSVLERKDDDYYYFGHRSFQEFLVASRFLGDSFIIENEFEGLAKTCNEEILAFITDGGNVTDFLEACNSSLQNYHGEIASVFIRFLIENYSSPVVSLSDIYNDDSGPWCTYIRACRLGLLHYDETFKYAIGVTSKSFQFMAGMLGLLTNARLSLTTEDLVIFIIGLMHRFCFSVIHKSSNFVSVKNRSANIAVEDPESLAVVRALISSMIPITTDKNELVALDVEYIDLAVHLMGELTSKVQIAPIHFREPEKVRVPLMRLKDFSGMFGDDVENYMPTIRTFWRLSPKRKDFVNVVIKESKASRPTLTLR